MVQQLCAIYILFLSMLSAMAAEPTPLGVFATADIVQCAGNTGQLHPTQAALCRAATSVYQSLTTIVQTGEPQAEIAPLTFDQSLTGITISSATPVTQVVSDQSTPIALVGAAVASPSTTPYPAALGQVKVALSSALNECAALGGTFMVRDSNGNNLSAGNDGAALALAAYSDAKSGGLTLAGIGDCMSSNSGNFNPNAMRTKLRTKQRRSQINK